MFGDFGRIVIRAARSTVRVSGAFVHAAHPTAGQHTAVADRE